MKKLFFLLLIFAAPVAAEEPSLTEQEFTDEFVSVLATKLPDGSFEVTGPLTILLGDDAPRSGTMNLHNIYRNISSDPAERRAQIDAFIGVVMTPPNESLSPADRANILPVLRDDDFVAQAAANPDNAAVFMPLVADLSIMYVLDFPDRVQFLVASNLAELEIDRDGVHELAVGNLAAKSNDYIVHTMEGIYFLELDGMYESSALLLDDFWSAIESELGAPPVAAIPTRDILLFAPSNDDYGVALVNQLALQIEAETGYPISKSLLIRRNGRWESYE